MESSQHSQSRRSQPDYLTGNDGKTWVEDGIDGARLVREEDGDVPASEGCWLAQIMTQHHIQTIVSQRPGDLLGRCRIIIVVPQSPFNRRQGLLRRLLQVVALRRVAPVAVHIHVPGNVVEDLFHEVPGLARRPAHPVHVRRVRALRQLSLPCHA